MGVPQDSVLGPILFCIYIDDLPSNMNSNYVCFDEGTTAISSSYNPDRLQTGTKQTYVNHGMWFKGNGLNLTVEKTKVMSFSLVHHYSTTYVVNGITLSDSASLLGYTIEMNVQADLSTLIIFVQSYHR